MKAAIGYYVHHHGDGHRQRALAVARAADFPVTLIGTNLAGRTEDIQALDLADDAAGAVQGDLGLGESLHYAPCGHDGIRQRVARMSDWIAREKPALLVVDVSVEVAMLARLTATPLVYVRLSGRRNDPPHLDAFRAARAIIAPFHRDLDDPDVTAWVRDKTIYLPGLSRARPSPAAGTDAGTVLVVSGKGGGGFDGSTLAAAAAATPSRHWRAIGLITPPADPPPNLEIAGWVDTADADIAQAGIVIGHAGDGLVSAVIAAGRPFICLPQARPYDEQRLKAKRLRALGAALVLQAWPPAAAWPGLLRRAERLNPRQLHRLHDPQGAARAAAILAALAAA